MDKNFKEKILAWREKVNHSEYKEFIAGLSLDELLTIINDEIEARKFIIK
jgi:hypothetical protein